MKGICSHSSVAKIPDSQSGAVSSILTESTTKGEQTLKRLFFNVCSFFDIKLMVALLFKLQIVSR